MIIPFAFWYLVQKVSYFRELPADIRESRLKQEETSFLVSKWAFASVFPDAEKYIRFLITNFPSVALRHETTASRLIGWITLYSYGALAMLYVEPEFRGRGLGKYLILKLSQAVTDKRIPAFLLVEEANEAAQNMYMGFGFRNTNFHPQWFRCEPNMDLLHLALPNN